MLIPPQGKQRMLWVVTPSWSRPWKGSLAIPTKPVPRPARPGPLHGERRRTWPAQRPSQLAPHSRQSPGSFLQGPARYAAPGRHAPLLPVTVLPSTLSARAVPLLSMPISGSALAKSRRHALPPPEKPVIFSLSAASTETLLQRHLLLFSGPGATRKAKPQISGSKCFWEKDSTEHTPQASRAQLLSLPCKEESRGVCSPSPGAGDLAGSDLGKEPSTEPTSMYLCHVHSNFPGSRAAALINPLETLPAVPPEL